MKQLQRVRLAGTAAGVAHPGAGAHGWAPHLGLTTDELARPPCFPIIAALREACAAPPTAPLDVGALALGAASILRRRDPIVSVQSADLGDIDGVLYRTGTGGWSLLHQATLDPRETRFVQAWLLACYAMGEQADTDAFECRGDSLYWLADDDSPSARAYSFAARLTMPAAACGLGLTGHVDGDVLIAFAQRLQVPLLHAARRWLARTAQKAVLVLDDGGTVRASWLSETACSAGWRIDAAAVPARAGQYAVGSSSDVMQAAAVHERRVAMSDWFARAPAGGQLIEASLGTVGGGRWRFGLTLLQLPRDAVCPQPRAIWPQYRASVGA
ncbi:hypothetical protein J5T34_16485 [Cupriavidus gilardii]|uniref:hypothetical protein n=1 Tax=Cupriavidus gilardii TaxID=82541 RepID=UPI001ABE07D4|nr:hypothetical protein [Cupriavidus gilardii]MBO4122323.1 hypothetical protein [Cupriavidus gilardii]